MWTTQCRGGRGGCTSRRAGRVGGTRHRPQHDGAGGVGGGGGLEQARPRQNNGRLSQIAAAKGIYVSNGSHRRWCWPKQRPTGYGAGSDFSPVETKGARSSCGVECCTATVRQEGQAGGATTTSMGTIFSIKESNADAATSTVGATI